MAYLVLGNPASQIDDWPYPCFLWKEPNEGEPKLTLSEDFFCFLLQKILSINDRVDQVNNLFYFFKGLFAELIY